MLWHFVFLEPAELYADWQDGAVYPCQLSCLLLQLGADGKNICRRLHRSPESFVRSLAVMRVDIDITAMQGQHIGIPSACETIAAVPPDGIAKCACISSAFKRFFLMVRKTEAAILLCGCAHFNWPGSA